MFTHQPLYVLIIIYVCVLVWSQTLTLNDIRVWGHMV